MYRWGFLTFQLAQGPIYWNLTKNKLLGPSFRRQNRLFSQLLTSSFWSYLGLIFNQVSESRGARMPKVRFCITANPEHPNGESLNPDWPVSANLWNKVFLLNLVRKLWRTDKSNTFLRVMPPVQLLPQTLPDMSQVSGPGIKPMTSVQQPGHFTTRLPRDGQNSSRKRFCSQIEGFGIRFV